MDDLRIGKLFLVVRQQLGLRQTDLAAAATVPVHVIRQIEHGHLAGVSLERLRRVGATLEIRIDLVGRLRGAEGDRLLGRRHDLLATDVTADFQERAWQLRAEVSFSIYGERGSIDLLAWHEPSRTLLVIELKTELVDAGATLMTLDRKRRLAREIARGLGWDAATVAVVLIIADGRTNRRRFAERSSMIRTALPSDGRAFRAWLRRPAGPVAATLFWREPVEPAAAARHAPVQRVRRPRAA